MAIGRRELLLSGGAAGLAAVVAGFSASNGWADPRFPADPFALGIASGDPWPDGVVLWTRLASDPLALDTSISTKMDGEDLDQGSRNLLDANAHIRFTGYQRGFVTEEGNPGLQPA